ncbi:MAG: ABC transporter substrate-binding protein [Cyanobacteria bacterium J06607_13]
MRHYLISKPFRQQLTLLMCLLSLCFVLGFAACSRTDGPDVPQVMPRNVRIGYQVIPNVELLAKNLKLAERKFPDVHISWQPFSAGWRVNAAMLEGEIDIGMVGSIPAATAIAQGLPIQVYTIHNIINENEALAVKNTGGIKTMTDLRGKTIAVPFGSTSHFSLLSAIAQSGLDTEEVTIRDMGISEMTTAWDRDTIDGSFVWQTTLSQLLNNDGSVLMTAGDVSEAGALTADLGTVSNEFISTYPQFLADFVTVLDDAVQFYREKPREAASAIAREVGFSAEDSLAAMNELIWLTAEEQSSAQYMGTPDDPGAVAQMLKDSADFMATLKAIPPAPDLAIFEDALYEDALHDNRLDQEATQSK